MNTATFLQSYQLQRTGMLQGITRTVLGWPTGMHCIPTKSAYWYAGEINMDSPTMAYWYALRTD